VSDFEPVLRRAARAIVIDEAGRTLLFRARIPGRNDGFIWITPGGGINEGEDEVACVRREVFEETGLAHFEVGPCVWLRDHTFRWGDGALRQVESYFVVRAESFAVDISNQEELERGFLTAFRWFSIDELHSHDERLVPANFAELLSPLLAGEYPAEPLTVGV